MYLIKPGSVCTAKTGDSGSLVYISPCGKGAIRYIIYVRICAEKQNFREYGENP